MLIYYVRHGHPNYIPNSLTPLGVRQAEAVARRLARYGVDAVYASDSERAIQTAMPTAELIHKSTSDTHAPITLLPFCNENVAGKYFRGEENGKRQWLWELPGFTRLLASDEMASLGYEWYKHPVFAERHAEEGFAYVSEELDALLASLGFEHDRKNHVYHVRKRENKRIALFAHEGIGKVIMSSMLDIPLPMFAVHTDMCHSGLSVIRFAENEDTCVPRIITYSNDAHLFYDNIPNYYGSREPF